MRKSLISYPKVGMDLSFNLADAAAIERGKQSRQGDTWMATATVLTDFVRYLVTNDDLVGPSERLSLERMLKAPPSSYSGIWETGVLSGEQLAEAIGGFHG